ncbi:hypothetical protein DR999_PMT06081 [Platysternon megacephalum]|uniref:Uncharacterized protein n=1 Tax=Platysternon megacephalum TaxID=55544 RepID=A0A4D9EKE4_9SAUR|nr:hypothetical protein DR999_PMT06081 [Platysternon megacephalum]
MHYKNQGFIIYKTIVLNKSRHLLRIHSSSVLYYSTFPHSVTSSKSAKSYKAQQRSASVPIKLEKAVAKAALMFNCLGNVARVEKAKSAAGSSEGRGRDHLHKRESPFNSGIECLSLWQ